MALLLTAIEGLEAWTLVFVLTAVFAGAFVRGYTGFGSSLLWVPSLALILEPVSVVPITYALELVASLWLMPPVRREAEWGSLRWIWLGTGLGLPAGLWLITSVPGDATRTALAVVVVTVALLLLGGVQLRGRFSRPGVVGVGGAAGFLAGAVGIPGPPVFLYYLSLPLPIATARASILVYFVGGGLLAVGLAWAHGLFGLTELLRVAMLTPVTILGLVLGAQLFRRSPPDRARQVILYVLMGIGAGLFIRVLAA